MISALKWEKTGGRESYREAVSSISNLSQVNPIADSCYENVNIRGLKYL
jgi:hypothetical protein